MISLWPDLRFSLRAIRRSPLFASSMTWLVMKDVLLLLVSGLAVGIPAAIALGP
jgi:hypothetical protein